MNTADIKGPKTKFVRVKCNNCGNEQNIFSAITSNVKCLVCGSQIAETTASRTRVKTKVTKILN